MKNSIKYEALPGDDSSGSSGEDALMRSEPKMQRPKGFSVLSFSSGCLSMLIIMAIFLALRRTVFTPKTGEQLEAEEWNDCGRSVEAAKAKGCIMEPMFYGFLPPQCVFPELSKQFPIFEDRPYYSDENMTQLVTPDEMWNGKHSVVYTTKYHDEHCLYQWRKLHYAMTHRMEYLDNKTMSIGHATHCANQLTEKCEGESGNLNYIVLGFFKCRKTAW